MPELPEVETMRRGILGVRGCRIAGVAAAACKLKPIGLVPKLAAFRRRAVGARIDDVGRVGKRVVLLLDTGDRIVLEPRMTGLVLVAAPPNRAHLRLRFSLEGGPVGELLYWDRRGLGRVQLLTAEEFAERYSLDRVGPDALLITAETLRQRFGSSRRAIKVALLDQRAMAGVGNLYASEILHRCRVSPLRPCDRLRPQEWKLLHAAMREVLESAIRHEGSTLSDGTYRNALSQDGGYQNHHRVYDRAGKACLTCGRGPIRRIVQAQRSTFFCPVCQRVKRAAP